MKILLFSTGFYEYMIELANAMSEHAEVVLMLPNNRIDEVHINSISPKVKFESFELIDYKSIRDNVKMIIDVVKKIRKQNPDVLHIQTYGHHWFYLAYPFLLKYKIVNTVHDPNPHQGDKLTQKDILSEFFGKIFISKYIVHGEFLKDELVKHQNIIRKKIFVIPHGHLGLYKNWRKEKIEVKKNHILFFGRIFEYKGLDYLIKAAPIVAKEIPDVKFVIAGTGDNYENIKEFNENKNLFITKKYRIPNSEVDSLFQETEIVVLPYLEATQSGVIPVAFAYGKPVIVTNVGSLPEVVDDGINGFIVEPKNEKIIADKIIELLKNQTILKTMSDNAFKTSNEKISWKIIAEKTLNSYK